jgi:hypothetical protein
MPAAEGAGHGRDRDHHQRQDRPAAIVARAVKRATYGRPGRLDALRPRPSGGFTGPTAAPPNTERARSTRTVAHMASWAIGLGVRPTTTASRTSQSPHDSGHHRQQPARAEAARGEVPSGPRSAWPDRPSTPTAGATSAKPVSRPRQSIVSTNAKAQRPVSAIPRARGPRDRATADRRRRSFIGSPAPSWARTPLDKPSLGEMSKDDQSTTIPAIRGL